MRILVTFAVEAEFAPWRRRHAFTSIRIGGLTLFRSQIAQVEVSVLLTGIGRHAAGQAMGALMKALDRDNGFEFCISSGLAGALSPQHIIGEILVPRRLKASGVHADLNGDRLECDASLVDLAAGCGAEIIGSFCTADRILISPEEKASFGRHADAVEMESFDVVKQASFWGARAAAVRAISDAAEEDLPLDFNRTLSDSGKVRVSRVLSELRRRPQALPSLLRFAKQSRRAAGSLADFLDRYIEALAKQSMPSTFEEVAAT